MGFDEEQKDWIRRVMRRAGLAGTSDEVERLAGAIETSIKAVETDEREATTFREAHDALRDLFVMITEADPSIGLIRSRSLSLPVQAKAHVERRAMRLRPEDFGSEGAFWTWTQSARAEDLLSFLRLLIADGGTIIVGRSRPNGSRSRPRFEPIIMGLARGASGESKLSFYNGRPVAFKAGQLVMYLAVDWTLMTNEPPAAGRSEAKPFGELVHQVFGWLEWPGADQALRRYWDAVRRERTRTQT